MSWHYSAARTKNPDGSYYYFVIERFSRFSHKGNRSVRWTDTPEYATGDSKAELIEDLEMMLEDVKKYNTKLILPPKSNVGGSDGAENV